MIEWITNIGWEFWLVLGEMAPYLLFGFLVAGVLSVFISPEWVERHLGGRGIWPVIKASAFGVPLPLCSCGVIPVATSIHRHGASRAATTAFLISTPQTGVDSVFATFSLLGPVFAIYRPFAALFSGILGGSVVAVSEKPEPPNAPDKVSKCNDACCAGKETHGRCNRAIRYAFGTLPKDIGRPLLIGLGVAAIISALIPDDYFSKFIPPGPLQILVLMLVGVPIYLCATASIPIAAKLILAGVSPGAAFALLMTGPATNAATLVTIWKVLGRRTCLIYLGTMLVAAFLGGMLLDSFLTIEKVRSSMQHGMIPRWIKTTSAIALLIILAIGAFYRPKKDASHNHEPSDTCDSPEKLDVAHKTIMVKGMTCQHCVQSVRSNLLQCPGVTAVDVDLPTGEVKISGNDLDEQAIHSIIQELGYKIQ